MNKRKFFILLSAVILAFIAWKWLGKDNNKTSLDPESIDFKIEKPEEITRIVLTNKSGKQINLRQSDNQWVLNDKYPASEKQLRILLFETMAKISIKGMVHKNARKNVIGRMASTGVKVEAFKGKELVKTYYVGGTTPDLMGTYFWMPGSENPMIVQIVGLDGFLNTRYNLDEDVWISRSIFSTKKENIKNVTVQYPSNPNNSFSITQDRENIILGSSNESSRSANLGALKSYLNHFEKLNFENFTENLTPHEIDSISQQTPIAIIRLEQSNGTFDELTIYPKGSFEEMRGLYTESGEKLAHDPDRYYAKWSKLDRLLLIQDYTFNKVLKTHEDFLNRL